MEPRSARCDCGGSWKGATTELPPSAAAPLLAAGPEEV